MSSYECKIAGFSSPVAKYFRKLLNGNLQLSGKAQELFIFTYGIISSLKAFSDAPELKPDMYHEKKFSKSFVLPLAGPHMYWASNLFTT